eukprot:7414351-Alexandrium_andersonii.AAC.1
MLVPQPRGLSACVESPPGGGGASAIAGAGLDLADGIGPVGRDRFVLLVGDADGCPYALPGVSEPPEFRAPVLKGRWAERMIVDGNALWRLRVGARG